MNEQMYREHILDLYKNPLNFGNLENCTHSCNKNNPLCGDEMSIYLEVRNNKVKDIKFQGIGCAISIASASLLTNKIKGMPVNNVRKLKNEDITKLLQIPISHVRMKCALLCLETTKEALK